MPPALPGLIIGRPPRLLNRDLSNRLRPPNSTGLLPQRTHSLRKELLDQPGADPIQVESEYNDAKAREAAAEREGMDWDERAGGAALRKQFNLARYAEEKAAMRMARTKPTTPAGAAALVEYARRDIVDQIDNWPIIALKTIATALASMYAEAA